ncbi:MAG: CPBP family intramembrane metalloprotease [Bacteroidales bacterium]|nr:CPBP family intramembrane metalloprotease [Bacteroidales bacterium]
MKSNFRETLLAGSFYLLAGSILVVVFNPWDPLLGLVTDYFGRAVVISILFFMVVWHRGPVAHNMQLQKICTGLFIMAVAMSADWIISSYLLNTAGINNNNIRSLSMLKLNECLVVWVTIISLSMVTGSRLHDIYLSVRKPVRNLLAGLILFIVSASTTFFAAPLLFESGKLDPEILLGWAPWLLMFCMANGFMEELIFRGLFLKKLEPALGKAGSNIMIGVVFSGIHLLTSYSSDRYIFVAVLFPFALLWGYLTQRTGNILVSALFHAGMDIPVMTGIFSVMVSNT